MLSTGLDVQLELGCHNSADSFCSLVEPCKEDNQHILPVTKIERLCPATLERLANIVSSLPWMHPPTITFKIRNSKMQWQYIHAHCIQMQQPQQCDQRISFPVLMLGSTVVAPVLPIFRKRCKMHQNAQKCIDAPECSTSQTKSFFLTQVPARGFEEKRLKLQFRLRRQHEWRPHKLRSRTPKNISQRRSWYGTNRSCTQALVHTTEHALTPDRKPSRCSGLAGGGTSAPGKTA